MFDIALHIKKFTIAALTDPSNFKGKTKSLQDHSLGIEFNFSRVTQHYQKNPILFVFDLE